MPVPIPGISVLPQAVPPPTTVAAQVPPVGFRLRDRNQRAAQGAITATERVAAYIAGGSKGPQYLPLVARALVNPALGEIAVSQVMGTE